MASPDLTTVQHVMHFLPDRTLTAAVADAVAVQLRAASTILRDYIRPDVPGLSAPGIPAALEGEAATDFLSRCGVETDMVPETRLFGGHQHKLLAECAKTDGSTATASILIQPAELIGVKTFALRHPLDAALTESAGAIVFTLEGVPASGPNETLLEATVLPGPGGTTTLAPPADAPAFPRYRILLAAEGPEAIALSRIDMTFPDASRTHLAGLVPDAVSEACARFAAHLFYRAGRDGIGKGTDETGRSYAGSAIPADIRAILDPYRPSGIIFL